MQGLLTAQVSLDAKSMSIGRVHGRAMNDAID